MNVLVIGGAGYIGSHCVRQLQLAGHSSVVLDNMVFGHRQAISPEISFYEGELGNSVLTTEIKLQEFSRIDRVGQASTGNCHIDLTQTQHLQTLDNSCIARGARGPDGVMRTGYSEVNRYFARRIVCDRARIVMMRPILYIIIEL